MILAVAPTGARRGKKDHPGLPMRLEEISAEARSCADAGASILHLHVRGPHGSHSIDPGLYEDVIAAVREETGDRLLIQATTEAAGVFSRPEQFATATTIRPDSISLAVREICPDAAAEQTAKSLYEVLARRKILVQHIAYDPCDLTRLQGLRERAVIPESVMFVQIVLGRYGGRDGDQRDFEAFAPLLTDPSCIWSVCCFGPWESMAVSAAAASGGHARVGFENNLIARNGSPAASNTQLVDEAAGLIRATGRALATRKDITDMFPVLK